MSCRAAPVRFLRGMARHRFAVDYPLGNEQDGTEGLDAVKIEHVQPQGAYGIEDRPLAAGTVRVVGLQSGPCNARIGRVDGERLGRHRLDLANHFGHELRRPSADVHVNVGGALLVLETGQLQQPVDIARIKKLFCRGHGIVDRFADDRQIGDRHFNFHLSES